MIYKDNILKYILNKKFSMKYYIIYFIMRVVIKNELFFYI